MMAGVKVSDLPKAASLSPVDLIEVVQNGENRVLTGAQLTKAVAADVAAEKVQAVAAKLAVQHISNNIAAALEIARDLAIIQPGVFATEALGRAAVADGSYFKVAGSGDVACYEYRRNNSEESFLIASYPSVSGVKSEVARVVGPGGAVINTDEEYILWARVFVDVFGRISAGIKQNGDFVISSLITDSAKIASIESDRFALGASSVEVSDNSFYSKIVVDEYGRMVEGTRRDGGKLISKLYDGQSRDVYSRLQYAIDTSNAAMSAVAIFGNSDFKKTMLHAQKLHGFWPKPSMSVPPVLTLNGGSPPSPLGFRLIPWNNTTSWRTLGGYTSQFGGNPFLQFLTLSPTGNSTGYTANLGCSVEFTHSGTEFYIYLRGSGSSVRVIVDGAYASSDRLVTSPDGQGYQLHVDFTISGTASRKIRIESAGMQFGGIYVKNGESIAMPTDMAPPKVCILGTSITEGGAAIQPMGGYAWWLARLLGVDAYACGVGGAGILNPGLNGRVKQRDRSQDYTAGDFSLCIDENGINDGSYSFTAFRDEYRRNLDLWFAAHPNSPWIGWGPFWPTSNPSADAYKIRDAKQQVINEYPLASFIDTLDSGPFVPSAMQSQYIDTDNTHPLYLGAQHIGSRLFNCVDSLIRTRF